MQDWTIKFKSSFDDNNMRVREGARKYHHALNKFNVTLREAQVLWFCTAYMDGDQLEIGVMKAYGCNADEASAIVSGANWGKPGDK